jgi:hypothetical protein
VSKTPAVTTAPPWPVKVAEKLPVACAPPTVPGSVIVTLQDCFVPVWTKSTEKVPGVPMSPPSPVVEQACVPASGASCPHVAQRLTAGAAGETFCYRPSETSSIDAGKRPCASRCTAIAASAFGASARHITVPELASNQ